MSEQTSALRRGFSFASTAIGILTASIAIFNLAIHQLHLPLAPIVEPLVSVYQSTVVPLLETIRLKLPGWAYPDWGHDTVVAVFIMANAYMRGMSLFSKDRDNSVGASLASVAVVSIMLAIPFVRYLVAILSIFPIVGIWGRETRPVALYMIGCVGGAGLLFLLNSFY